MPWAWEIELPPTELSAQTLCYRGEVEWCTKDEAHPDTAWSMVLMAVCLWCVVTRGDQW